MTVCIYGDPTCPCQDGDVCHYVDSGKTKAMMVSPEYVLNARRAAEVQSEDIGWNEAIEACIECAVSTSPIVIANMKALKREQP